MKIRVIRKMLKFIIVSVISIVAIVLSVIGLYYLFTGGIQAIEHSIRSNGLWNSIVNFCKQFWQGLKTTLGF